MGVGATNSRRKRKARVQWRVFTVGISLGVGATLALQYLIPEAPISLLGVGLESERSSRDADSFERETPEFRFFTFLPDFELDVDTSHLADRSSDASEELVYLLQIAAYRQEDRANAHRAALLLEGLDTYVVTVYAEADDPWYQVRMGPFERREDASIMSRRLVELAYGERLNPLVLVQR